MFYHKSRSIHVSKQSHVDKAVIAPLLCIIQECFHRNKVGLCVNNISFICADSLDTKWSHMTPSGFRTYVLFVTSRARIKWHCKLRLWFHLMGSFDCIHSKSAYLGILKSQALQFGSSVTQHETLEMLTLRRNTLCDILVWYVLEDMSEKNML